MNFPQPVGKFKQSQAFPIEQNYVMGKTKPHHIGLSKTKSVNPKVDLSPESFMGVGEICLSDDTPSVLATGNLRPIQPQMNIRRSNRMDGKQTPNRKDEKKPEKKLYGSLKKNKKWL